MGSGFCDRDRMECGIYGVVQKKYYVRIFRQRFYFFFCLYVMLGSEYGMENTIFFLFSQNVVKEWRYHRLCSV